MARRCTARSTPIRRRAGSRSPTSIAKGRSARSSQRSADQPPQTVGAVGLGVGTVACYRRPGQRWTFFEIDPLVERIARDRRYFHYLEDCAPDAEVVLGDARRSLQQARAGSTIS